MTRITRSQQNWLKQQYDDLGKDKPTFRQLKDKIRKLETEVREWSDAATRHKKEINYATSVSDEFIENFWNGWQLVLSELPIHPSAKGIVYEYLSCLRDAAYRRRADECTDIMNKIIHKLHLELFLDNARKGIPVFSKEVIDSAFTSEIEPLFSN